MSSRVIDACLMPTLGELLDQQAGLLHAALADRVYTDGFERQLAENLIAAIPAAKRGEVLEHMLEWDHLMPRVMAVDCLLDETDDRSYEAVLLRTGIGRVRLAVRIGTWTVRGRPGLQIRQRLDVRRPLPAVPPAQYLLASWVQLPSRRWSRWRPICRRPGPVTWHGCAPSPARRHCRAACEETRVTGRRCAEGAKSTWSCCYPVTGLTAMSRSTSPLPWLPSSCGARSGCGPLPTVRHPSG